jgi:hypothetical protein
MQDGQASQNFTEHNQIQPRSVVIAEYKETKVLRDKVRIAKGLVATGRYTPLIGDCSVVNRQ